MNRMSRSDYVKKYHKLGEAMFKYCVVPTVGDFVNYLEKDEKATEKVNKIARSKAKDIQASVMRRNSRYSNSDSRDFMNSVIESHITSITEAGYFYKKLISSCDNMVITEEDCGSIGDEFELPITEDVFNYRIRNHWVTELNKYVEDYEDVKDLTGIIHVRSFLNCSLGPRCFCKKCAGIFRRSYDTEFTPNNIGSYATLMITEHATQSALDAMNKSGEGKVNNILEQKLEKFLDDEDDETEQTLIKIKSFDQAKKAINQIIEKLDWSVGVESRFYEIALLSRWRDNKFVALQTSMKYQPDKLGYYIWRSEPKIFEELCSAGTFEADSLKTRIAFDRYKDYNEDGNN